MTKLKIHKTKAEAKRVAERMKKSGYKPSIRKVKGGYTVSGSMKW